MSGLFVGLLLFASSVSFLFGAVWARLKMEARIESRAQELAREIAAREVVRVVEACAEIAELACREAGALEEVEE